MGRAGGGGQQGVAVGGQAFHRGRQVQDAVAEHQAQHVLRCTAGRRPWQSARRTSARAVPHFSTCSCWRSSSKSCTRAGQAISSGRRAGRAAAAALVEVNHLKLLLQAVGRPGLPARPRRHPGPPCTNTQGRPWPATRTYSATPSEVVTVGRCRWPGRAWAGRGRAKWPATAAAKETGRPQGRAEGGGGVHASKLAACPRLGEIGVALFQPWRGVDEPCPLFAGRNRRTGRGAGKKKPVRLGARRHRPDGLL